MKMLPPTFGPLSSVFGNDSSDDKLSTGITVGYPILRIKGKVWSITRGSNEPHVLMRADGDGPRNSIEVVLLAASQYVSKVWYEQGYEDGSTAPPDCFSANGVVPDPSSSKKQNGTCLGCKQNAWGSKVTPAGKPAKACGDSKRAAVSPLGDIRNDTFGGPMLLRVPAASLADFANYGDGMDARGYKYWTIGTKMSFDPNEAYPRLVFEPVRPLVDDEAKAVLELRDSAAVKSILAETAGDFIQEVEVEAKVKLPASFPQEPVAPQPVTPKVTTPLPPKPSPVDGFGGLEPKVQPQHAPKAAPTVKAAAPPPSSAATSTPPGPEGAATAAAGDFESMLDDQIESLMPSS